MSESFESIRIVLPRDSDVLHRFYNELMKRNFPIADELESLSVWLDQLNGRGRDGRPRVDDGGVKRCTFNIIVFTDKRSGTHSDAPIVGGIVFEYYRPSNCALITYLVTAPHVRGLGLSVFMTIRAWTVMCELSSADGDDHPAVIFCEVNNPARVADGDDAFSPLARIKAFQSAGVRQIGGFSYVQPSLSAQQSESRDMLLAAVVGPMTQRDDNERPIIDAATLLAFLTDLYTELGVDPHSDKDFASMRRSLSGRTSLPLIDFDTRRAIAQTNTNKQEQTQSDAHRVTSAIPFHVVVVGAGLSGLACAQELKSLGVRVTVLEGRHRVGGRVYTGRSFDQRVDLGAAWIHGIDDNPLFTWLNQRLPNAQLHRSDEQSIALFDHRGQRIDDETLMKSYLKYVNIIEQINDKYESAQTDDTSLFDAVSAAYRLHESNHFASVKEKICVNYLFGQCESLQNASMTDLAAKDYGYGTQFDGGDHLIGGGFYQIAHALANKLDVTMDAAVTHINSRADTNKIECVCADGRRFDGDAVVVTVPIGVLQHGDITFTPPLPEWKSASISGMGRGLFNKVILRFESVFWDRVEYIGAMFEDNTPTEHLNDLSTAHCRRSNCFFVNMTLSLGRPILVAMLSGTFAAECEAATNEQTVRRCLVRLRLIYGSKVSALLDSAVTRWGSDPFSRCSYSFLRVGADIGIIDRLAAPVEDRIFFAGEHTSKERFGYADGAFASGQREAKRIFESRLKEAHLIQSKL